jgi:flagellar biosynthetic protein FlhB
VAESTGQERTEQATPRRRQKAREEGNVPRSMEVISVVVLFAGLVGLGALGPRMVELGSSVFTRLWPDAATRELTQASTVSMARELGWLFASILAPLVGMVAVAGVGANLLQTGVMLSAKPLAPKAKRISPATGLKKIFSKRGMMELTKSLVKIAVVAAAVAWAMSRTVQSFFPLIGVALGAAYGHIVATMLHLAGTAALALALLAILDFWFQRFEYEEQLKMTRQEVKDEYKQNEGDPRLKGKVREKQRQISRQRMMQDVASADVVVTNPIRFAVALKYDPATMKAPRVVGKGARLVAKRIRDLARENGIPIVENPPLARALYKAVQVGSDVPVSLYQAVAEVLAFIWRRRDGVAAAAGGAR